MGIPCDDCCGAVCKCECEHCSDTAPCCWRVVIAGIIAEDPEECADCPTLDKTYSLVQDTNNRCLWKCIEVQGVECDDSHDIRLTIYLEGSNYKIKVALGNHIWIKDYGTSKPDCCSIINDELTHDSSDLDCDSSAATCFITRVAGDATNASCPCNNICPNVLPPTPPCFKIEWVGISTRSPLETGDCRFCDCYVTNPQWLPWKADSSPNICTWSRRHGGLYGHFCDDTIQVTIRKVAGSIWRVEVFQGDWPPNVGVMYRKDYDTLPDVVNWNQEEIPKVTPISLNCDYTAAAKVLLTPDYVSECDDLAWTCVGCLCQQDADRPDVQVEIGNVSPFFDCCADFNDTFILTPDANGCTWSYVLGDCLGGNFPERWISLNVYGIPAIEMRWRKNFNRWYSRNMPIVDCHSFDITFNDGPYNVPNPWCMPYGTPAPRAFTI